MRTGFKEEVRFFLTYPDITITFPILFNIVICTLSVNKSFPPCCPWWHCNTRHDSDFIIKLEWTEHTYQPLDGEYFIWSYVWKWIWICNNKQSHHSLFRVVLWSQPAHCPVTGRMTWPASTLTSVVHFYQKHITISKRQSRITHKALSWNMDRF